MKIPLMIYLSQSNNHMIILMIPLPNNHMIILMIPLLLLVANVEPNSNF